MADLKRRLYERATGRPGAGGRSIDLSWFELVSYLWSAGGRPWMRGLRARWRIGACGSGVRIGRRVRLLFPKHLFVGDRVAIGDDSYINALAINGIRLGHGVRVREGAWIQCTSSLDHPGVGLSIGDGTYIGPRSLLGAGGGITIGRHVTFGAGVHLLAENHQFRDAERLIQDQGVTRQGIVIEDDVWIGNNVIVLDGVRVGRGAVIGAAAVVTKDVPECAVVAGNPARVIGSRQGAVVQ